jgi:hypothetical protein
MPWKKLISNVSHCISDIRQYLDEQARSKSMAVVAGRIAAQLSDLNS